jgi:hypothetical protein
MPIFMKPNALRILQGHLVNEFELTTIKVILEFHPPPQHSIQTNPIILLGRRRIVGFERGFSTETEVDRVELLIAKAETS